MISKIIVIFRLIGLSIAGDGNVLKSKKLKHKYY